MIKIETSRTNTLEANLAKYKERLARKIELGLKEVARVLYDESQILVPKDTTYLAQTGRIDSVGGGFNIIVWVGYGGIDFPPRQEFSQREKRIVTRYPCEYCVYVHQEEPGTRSDGGPRHDPPEQDQFLEEPKLTKMAEMRAALNAVMKSDL